MRNPSIQKTTAISLFFHTIFFMVLMVTVKRQSPFTMPSAYTVNLVSIKKSLSVKNTPPIAEKAPIPSQKKEVKKKVKPVQEKEVKTVTEKDMIPSIKVEKSLQKERTSLIEERISALRAKKRIEKITHLRSIIDLKKADQDNKMTNHQQQSTTGSSTSEEGAVSDKNRDIMDVYVDSIGKHIKNHWAFPDTGEENLLTIVSFKIRRDGSIEHIKMEESSGNAFFDRSALKAISKAVPLPRPPFEMEVGIRFYP